MNGVRATMWGRAWLYPGVTIIFIFYCEWIHAQLLRPIQIDGSAAYSKNFVDVLAGATDPAAMMGQNGFSAGVAGERPYLLPGMSAFMFAGMYATHRSSAGLQVQINGAAGYQESLAGISYGRLLGKIRVGARFNYHRIIVAGYGSSGTASADISLIWDLTDKLRAGILLLNPLPASFGVDNAEKYPSAFRLGAGYDLSNECYLFIVAEKFTTATADVNFGLHYNIRQKLFLRLGMHTGIMGPQAAAGWQLQLFRLYITGSYHPELGLSPGIQLIFKQKKSDE